MSRECKILPDGSWQLSKRLAQRLSSIPAHVEYKLEGPLSRAGTDGEIELVAFLKDLRNNGIDVAQLT